MATVQTPTTPGEQKTNTPVIVHNSRQYLSAGEKYLKSNEFHKAASVLKLANEAMPADPHILLHLAKAHQGMGEREMAIEYLSRALKLKSNFAEAHYLLVTLRQEKSILERSVQLHEKKIAQTPNEPHAYYVYGQDLIQGGQWQKAVQILQKAIELKPEFTEAYYQLGVVYTRIEKFDWAIQQFEKVLQLRPDYLDASIQVAILYLRQGKFDEAAHRLDEILEKHPQLPDLNFYRGECYRRQGRWADSIGSYQTAAQNRPNFEEAWGYLAQACRHIGQWEEARLSAQRALQLNDHDAPAYFILGLCALQKKQGVPAKGYFEKYLALEPEGTDAVKAQYYLADIGKGVISQIT